MRRIYFDNAATTPILPEVKRKMLLAMEIFGNASSLHEEGRQARKLIEEARISVASSINADPEETIFTSGGSEANNMVLNTMWGLIFRGSKRKEIIVSAIEHPSILVMAKFLQSLGFIVHYLPVNKNGRVVMSEYQKLLSPKTLLVSVMLANNEIGTIQDVQKLASKAKKSGALFHTDAVQAFGKISIDVKELNIDYLTISGHKIGGPKGVGALYARSGSPIVPLILGGHQERNLRAGTENNLAIIGFSEAVKSYKLSNVETMRQKLRDGILNTIPNVIMNGDQKHCLSNILNVTFAGVEGESVLLKLDNLGISVSTGSACATGDITSSHVLMAIGADPEKAHGSIRFSFGPENTMKEVDKVLIVLPGIISDLRKISTEGSKYE